MAHHLSLFGINQAEMAYTGTKPWHGLGQEVENGAPLETWMEQAHLNWSYKEAPVQFTDEEGLVNDYPNFKVIYRSDTKARMSVVSNRYKTVQPVEMIEFFRSLVDREGFEIDTLGALKGGRRIWALARTNIEDDVLGNDRVKAYLLLITSCDGSLATTAKFVSTRVVCWNTQAIALHKETGQAVKVRHNTVFDPNAVKESMGLVGARAFDDFLGRMRQLTKVKMTDNDARSVLVDILPAPVGATKIQETRGFVKIMSLFNGEGKGSTMPGVQGTAWGLLNAVTEYTDHHARARAQENRLDSAWFGHGADLKDKAETYLCEAF
jgi:phage/plasmid-like protein (TIGR03299 family)